MKTKLIAVVMSALIIITPIELRSDPEPPTSDTWLAVCVVAVAAIAAGAVYLVSKKCQPKYYWLMDDNERPKKYWVAAATRKECEINGWKRIGGPYTSASDAPPVHPPDTNVINELVGPVMKIQVESTSDFREWTPVYQTECDLEDFGYFPTNAAMFRLVVTP